MGFMVACRRLAKLRFLPEQACLCVSYNMEPSANIRTLRGANNP